MQTRVQVVRCPARWLALGATLLGLWSFGSAAQSGPAVRFINPGLAIMDVYSVAPDGSEKRWGGIGPNSTTVPIPTQAGQLWRFRLSPSSNADSRVVRDEYRASGEFDQFHTLPGFMNVAGEPSRDFIESVVGELAGNVAALIGSASNAAGLATNLACPQGTIGANPACWPVPSDDEIRQRVNRLWPQVAALAQELDGELTLVAEHLKRIQGSHPQLVAQLVDAQMRGDRSGMVGLLQLESLLARIKALPRSQVGRSFGPGGAGDDGLTRVAWQPQSGGASSMRPLRVASSGVPHDYNTVLLGFMTSFRVGLAVGAFWNHMAAYSDTTAEPFRFNGLATCLDQRGFQFPQVGASGGVVTFGRWKPHYDRAAGDSEGFVIGVAAVVGVAAEFWFDYDGNYLGYLVSLRGAGLDAGAAYGRQRLSGC